MSVQDIPENESPTMARTRQRSVIWFVGIVIVLLLSGTSFTIWQSRTIIRYVDVHSGRIKTVVTILGVTTRESTCETPFSTVILDSSTSPQEAEWKPYWSRSFGQGTSPHYRFHSVPNDLDVLVKVLRSGSQDEAVIRARCRDAVHLMETGRVDELQRYVGKIETGGKGVSP